MNNNDRATHMSQYAAQLEHVNTKTNKPDNRQILDNAGRVAAIRHEMALVTTNPANLEEAIARLAVAWQRDVQNVHEKSYADGTKGAQA